MCCIQPIYKYLMIGLRILKRCILGDLKGKRCADVFSLFRQMQLLSTAIEAIEGPLEYLVKLFG